MGVVTRQRGEGAQRGPRGCHYINPESPDERSLELLGA